MPRTGIQELIMRCLAISLLAIAVVSSASAQQGQQAQQQAAPEHVGASASSSGDTSNLPVEKFGKDDLIGITVYDAPEFSRTVRVDSDGNIRLPMLRQHIHAAGLSPADLEIAIAAALTDGNVLVDPVVTVTVAEFRSRPITVSGAVRTPVTFQAMGTVTLLDAITRAGGLAENAGAEILVSKPSFATSDKSGLLIQRIPARALISSEDPALNLHLEGGEDIRVPEAGRVFVLGRVKHPGAFFITDGSESSVMKALALSEGLDTFPSHKAYIYRVEGGSGGRSEIPIDLKKIMARKSPDVALMSSDILYIPDATGARAGMQVLTTAVGMSIGAASLAVYH
jgi:polysaccharide export outer membrane protein